MWECREAKETTWRGEADWDGCPGIVPIMVEWWPGQGILFVSHCANGDGTVCAAGTLPAVASVAPMTLNKIRLMKLICDRANMGKNRIWVIDPGDVAAMLGVLQITNADYATNRVLADGEIGTFAGFPL